MKDGNSSAPPPDLPHRSTERSSEHTPKTHDEVEGEETFFPPPLVGGVRGGGGTDTKEVRMGEVYPEFNRSTSAHPSIKNDRYDIDGFTLFLWEKFF